MIFSQSVLFLDYKKKEKDSKEYYSVNLLNVGGGYETISYIGDVSVLDSFNKYDRLNATFSIRSVDNSKENYFNKKLDCLSLVK